MTWFRFFLLLHVFTAIAVFGPTFAFPLIASFARKDPRNALLTTQISEAIETKIVLPGGVALPFFGMALILLGHFSLGQNGWLVASIILYVIAYFFALIVQRTNALKLIKLLKSLGAPPAALPAPEGGLPPVGGAQGPPPEVAALAQRLQFGGIFLTLLLVTIIVLMVWHPGCNGLCT
jgi:uncharacterized membrane protein